MNERITELAKLAQLEHCVSHVRLEEFAYLIVYECLNNMENCDGDLDFAIWKTKKDFGVKE